MWHRRWDFVSGLLRAADGGSSGGGSPAGAGSAEPGGSSGGGAPSSSGSSDSSPSSTTQPSTPSQVSSPGSRSDGKTADSGSAPPAPKTATPEPEQLNFAALFGDGEDPFSGLTPAPEAPPKPVAGAEPAQKAPEAPKAPVEAQKPQAGSEAARPQAAQEVTSQPEGLDLSDPVSLVTALRQNEAKFIEYAAQEAFSLTPEEIEALEADVVGTIPKLLAKVFVKSQMNMLEQLGRMTPGIVQRHTEAMKRNSEAEAEFYGMWPDIKPQAEVMVNGQKARMEMVVRQYAAVYRQMHPQATKEQMFAHLGPMVMMAANIVPTVGRQPTTNGRAPAALQSAFVPAAGGAGPVGQPTQVELSPVEAMFSFRDD